MAQVDLDAGGPAEAFERLAELQEEIYTARLTRPALLAGGPSPLPELPLQYADHALWQRLHLAGETLADARTGNRDAPRSRRRLSRNRDRSQRRR